MDESTLLIAEALAQSEVEAGIKRAVSQLPKQPADFKGLCISCGGEIPAAYEKSTNQIRLPVSAYDLQDAERG